ncbi:hypothetical protein J6590_086079 [Homalodisca vitripennis]|nr:hypothetical protein J6590_086079 [Homalodisca vitripennis]
MPFALDIKVLTKNWSPLRPSEANSFTFGSVQLYSSLIEPWFQEFQLLLRKNARSIDKDATTTLTSCRVHSNSEPNIIVHQRYCKGPRTDPCGTPAETDIMSAVEYMPKDSVGALKGVPCATHDRRACPHLLPSPCNRMASSKAKMVILERNMEDFQESRQKKILLKLRRGLIGEKWDYNFSAVSDSSPV